MRKANYALYYVRKSSILLVGTGVRKISSVACGFSSIKTNYFDYPKGLISRINEVYVFFNKISFVTFCFVAITLVVVLAWYM